MRFVNLAGWASISMLVVAGCNQQSNLEQAASLDGDWAVVARQGDGITATPEELQGMRWSVQGREIVGVDPGGSAGKMSFTLDHTKTPSEIDITAVDGNRQGETDAGIYSLQEQRLR